MNETAFASQIESLLDIYGWRWCHFRPAWSAKGYRTPIKGQKGFPDYCAVKPPRLLFIELKGLNGMLTCGQREWLEDLRMCCKGVEVYLWRPEDFDQAKMILERR